MVLKLMPHILPEFAQNVYVVLVHFVLSYVRFIICYLKYPEVPCIQNVQKLYDNKQR